MTEDEPDTGELVYAGPNVMLAYAEAPSDLARGATVGELFTGDIARRRRDGLYEIVGRRSRFAKVFGLRIDLDGIERLLAEGGTPARCVSFGEGVYAFSARRADFPAIAAAVAAECDIPLRSVHTAFLAREPLTANGKTDFGALERQAGVLADVETSSRPAPDRAGATVDSLRDLFAELLGRPDATESSSFASLGGDSLSYVELSVRLGEVLGTLPRDWHTRPISALVGDSPRRRRRGPSSRRRCCCAPPRSC